jgi:hypothetical protein
MDAVTPSRSRTWLMVLAAAGVLGYSWIAAGLRPFTDPENVFVALPFLPVTVLAVWWRGSPPAVSARPLPPLRGTVVWLVLFGALTAWELAALFSSPRDDHPTLSSIADTIMSIHPGRAAAFALWLALGAALAFGRTGEGSR